MNSANNNKDLVLIGGMALPNTVTFVSEDHVSSAWASREKIFCKVKPRWKAEKLLERFSGRPVPFLGVPRMVLFLFGDMIKHPLRAGAIIAFIISLSYLLYIALFSVWEYFYTIFTASPEPNNVLILNSFSPQFLSDLIILAIGFSVDVILLLLVRIYIASWHGAEHMVFSAYMESGATSIDCIKKQSPIHSRCGGRFFMPLILMQVPISYLVNCEIIPISAELAYALYFYLFMELMFTFDSFVLRLGDIKFFRKSSELLQRYVTTKQPGNQELKVAKHAMDSLICAHHDKENPDRFKLMELAS